MFIVNYNDTTIQSVYLDHDHPTDHSFILCKLCYTKSKYPTKTVTFRKSKNVDMALIRDGIMASGISDLVDNVSAVEEKVAQFEDTLISIMDKFMPLKTKTVTIRPDTE